MSVKVESTSDSPEAVIAATGGLESKESGAEEKSAPAASEQGESAEDSESEGVKDDAEAEKDDSSDEDGEESQDRDSQKPKKRSGFKRRIDKLNSKLSEEQREKEYWKQEALKHKKAEEPQSQKPAPKQAEASDKPKADDFDSHEDYVEALVDWKADQKIKADKAAERETQVKSEHEKQVQTHVERVTAFAEAHEDFHELMEEVDDIPMSLAVQEVILGSESGPELMYELAKNPEEYARICKLPAIAAARELGRIEARIQKASESTQTNTKEIKKSKAPAPIKPIGSKSATVQKSLDDMDYEEFRKVRQEQERNRRR